VEVVIAKGRPVCLSEASLGGVSVASAAAHAAGGTA
jgi:hypothetical protein